MPPESVTKSDLNGWPDQIGTPGRMSPECAVPDVETLLFLGRASIRKQAQQSTLECFLAEPRFEELILISRGVIDVAQVIDG